MKKHITTFWHWLGEEIELVLLLFLITLNIFDLFETLPPMFDYLDKLAGVTIIAYLIYQASPTKIIFGEKHWKMDLSLIISFIFLIFNKIIRFTAVGYELVVEKGEHLVHLSKAAGDHAAAFTLDVANVGQLTSADLTSHFYHIVMEQLSWGQHTLYFAVSDGTATELLAATMPPFSFWHIISWLDGSFFYFAKFVVENSVLLEKLSIYIGGGLLIVLAFYAAWNYRIEKSSMIHVIHGDANLLQRIHLRVVAVFFVFVFFFLFIFSLMVEWLGIVADAPIVFVGILFAVFAMVWHKKGRSTTAFITQIGETGESFYHQFVSLFHTPYGVALGLSGILLLHMLTDFGMYLIPYTLYQHEMIYFDQGAAFFAAGHEPLFSIVELFATEKSALLFKDLAFAQGFIADASVLWIYLFNVVALLFLFFAPAYIWWVLLKRRNAHEKKWLLVLSYVALIIFIGFPLIKVGTLDVEGLVGADMTTHTVFDNATLIRYNQTIAVGGGVGLSVWALSHFRFFRRELVYLSFAAASIFFGMYVAYYYVDMLVYYFDILVTGFGGLDWFLMFYFVVFGLVTLLFYPIAYVVFLYEAIKHYRLGKDD
jgi:hypothetical protein